MATTWDDLLRPGESNSFFNPPPDGTPFRAEVATYDGVNAWWLMELSRLIYCREAVSRAAFLLRARLEEVAFIDDRASETQAFLVAPPSRTWAALVFRGSAEIRDWLTNAEFLMAPWEGGGRVHAGYRRAFVSVQKRLEDALHGLPESCPLFFAGHSLGGAMATLTASWRKPAAAYTFGSPYVGDGTFGTTLDTNRLYRVVNDRDVVATVPPPLPPRLDYVHHGQLHKIGGANEPVDILRHNAFAPLLPMLHSTTFESFQHAFQNWASAFVDVVHPPEPLADHAPINYVNLLGTAAGILPRVPRVLPPPGAQPSA